MSKKHTWLALSAGMIFCTGLAVAGPYEDAMQSYYAADYTKAFPLLESQAKKANAEAEFQLGIMYSRGQGVEQDSKKAFEWWSKAASRGHAQAQEALAESYAWGVGVKQDWPKAVQWAKKSADKGNSNGQYLMGVWHENGQGGLKASAVDAYMWYSIAAAGETSFPAVVEAAARIEKTMSPEDIAAGKAKAEKWKAAHQKPVAKKK
jgi:TPR repeat protein